MTYVRSSLVLLAAVVAFASPERARAHVEEVAPDLTVECGTHEVEHDGKKADLNFCITRTRGSKNTDVLYYFHGMNQDERDWTSKPKFAPVREAWKKAGRDAPIVVAVSLGSRWLLAPKGEAEQSGLYELVVKAVFPYIEKKLLAEFSGRRLLVGVSMGGLNAAELMLNDPQLFARVALLCPAVPTFPVFAKEDGATSLLEYQASISEYAHRNHANFLMMLPPILFLRHFFTRADWDKSSPMALARRLLGPASPPLLVTAVHDDEFGLEESNLALYNLAHEKGAPAELSLIDGGHCQIDATRFADFLMK